MALTGHCYTLNSGTVHGESEDSEGSNRFNSHHYSLLGHESGYEPVNGLNANKVCGYKIL